MFETNDEDQSAPDDRRLCFDCVGEAFLSAEIQKTGTNDICFYCKGMGKTFSIREMATRVKLMLDQHFYCTATEPSGIEYAMIKEGDLDWERKGDPVGDIIQERALIEPEPAEDIRRILEEEHSDWESAQMGYENP